MHLTKRTATTTTTATETTRVTLVAKAGIWLTRILVHVIQLRACAYVLRVCVCLCAPVYTLAMKCMRHAKRADRGTDKQRARQPDKQTNRQIDKQTGKQTVCWANEHASTEAGFKTETATLSPVQARHTVSTSATFA